MTLRTRSGSYLRFKESEVMLTPGDQKYIEKVLLCKIQKCKNQRAGAKHDFECLKR